MSRYSYLQSAICHIIEGRDLKNGNSLREKLDSRRAVAHFQKNKRDGILFPWGCSIVDKLLFQSILIALINGSQPQHRDWNH